MLIDFKSNFEWGQLKSKQCHLLEKEIKPPVHSNLSEYLIILSLSSSVTSWTLSQKFVIDRLNFGFQMVWFRGSGEGIAKQSNLPNVYDFTWSGCD